MENKKELILKPNIQQAETKNYYSIIILIVSVVAVTAAIGLARFGFTMVLPSMKLNLEMSDSQAGDLAAGNMVGYLLFSLIGGLLASRFTPKIVIIISMAVVSLAMLCTGLANNFFTALVFRALTGLGSGGVNVPAMGLMAFWFAKRHRGLATGIVVSGSSFGLVITGLLVPYILKNYGDMGWRYTWYIYAAIAFFALLLCIILLKNKPAQTMNTTPRGSSLKWNLLYRNFNIWHLALIYVMFGFSYIIYATFFTLYLKTEGGFTDDAAGFLWSAIGIGSIASGFIWGWISDRIGRKYAISMIYFLQFLSFTIFGLWKAVPGFYISSVLFALTAFSIPAVMAATAGDMAGAKLAPAAIGFITLFFGLGQVIGPFVGGRLAESGNSYAPAFIAAGIAAFVGAVAALFLKHSKTSHEQE